MGLSSIRRFCAALTETIVMRMRLLLQVKCETNFDRSRATLGMLKTVSRLGLHLCKRNFHFKFS